MTRALPEMPTIIMRQYITPIHRWAPADGGGNDNQNGFIFAKNSGSISPLYPDNNE